MRYYAAPRSVNMRSMKRCFTHRLLVLTISESPNCWKLLTCNVKLFLREKSGNMNSIFKNKNITFTNFKKMFYSKDCMRERYKYCNLEKYFLFLHDSNFLLFSIAIVVSYDN